MNVYSHKGERERGCLLWFWKVNALVSNSGTLKSLTYLVLITAVRTKSDMTRPRHLYVCIRFD